MALSSATALITVGLLRCAGFYPSRRQRADGLLLGPRVLDDRFHVIEVLAQGAVAGLGQ